MLIIRRLVRKILRLFRGNRHNLARPDIQPSHIAPAVRPQAYIERQTVALSIDGMMSPFSMQVMDALLAHQEALGVTGHLLEFGVYKGRSASLVSAHVHEQERFILADINQLLTEEVLGKLYARPEFVLGRSEHFRDDPQTSAIRRGVRFLHVDSSHAYRTTLAEMSLIDDLLTPDGIAALDDFTNLHYSQILPAVFKYLYTTRTDLTFFLVTQEKGYLCRRPMFDRYGGFVLRELLGEMRMRGTSDAVLSRTDTDPEYRAFFIRERHPGEQGEHYGEHLYGEFYKAP
jgi:Methyltransferase domain